jgi:hypothetical protein
MPNSAPKFKGKNKRQIAEEAFAWLGKTATIQQVDEYFRNYYQLPFCERSMYSAVRRKALGKPTPVRRRYPPDKKPAPVAELVIRVTEVANAAGGWDELIELINVLRKV